MSVDISIGIPVHNQGSFLETAIRSSLHQTVRPFEVIISNNHSTDETKDIIEKYSSNKSIRCISPASFLGIEKHHRFIFQKCKSKYLALLCGDDAYAPKFIEKVLVEFKRNPNLAMVGTGSFLCNYKMDPFSVGGFSYPKEKIKPPNGFYRMLSACGYTISASVWNIEIIRQIPDLPLSSEYAFDWYYILWVGRQHPIKLLSKPLHYYRMHDLNLSHSRELRWNLHALAMLKHLHGFSSLKDKHLIESSMQVQAEKIYLYIQDNPHEDYSVNLEKLKAFLKNNISRKEKSLSIKLKEEAKEFLKMLIAKYIWNHPEYLK